MHLRRDTDSRQQNRQYDDCMPSIQPAYHPADALLYAAR